MIRGYIARSKLEKAGIRACPIWDTMWKLCAFMSNKTCATFKVIACKALGGEKGRGELIRNRQSSATTDARTEIQRVRSSDTYNWVLELGEGDRDFIPLLFRLALERRNGDIEGLMSPSEDGTGLFSRLRTRLV